MEKELKLLLLEDNTGDAFLFKFYLGESTNPVFNVSHAETLKGALDLLAQEKFDIVVSDMNLPDSTGVDTIKTILQKYPGNMLIVLTGLTDEDVGLETVRYGAQDFLVKGKFDGKVLISSIMFAFERFKLNNQLVEENTRLDALQQLLGVAYFEVNLDNDVMYLSNFALLYSSALISANETSVAERMANFEHTEELLAAFSKAKSETVSGESYIVRKADNRKFKVIYQSSANKFYGVFKDAEYPTQ
ncbi:MAG: response regulator [Chitinophagales bacterium]|nr:response regulator [Chitinophagales bacterium]